MLVARHLGIENEQMKKSILQIEVSLSIIKSLVNERDIDSLELADVGKAREDQARLFILQAVFR